MLNKTNRKLIVGSEILFVSNNLLTQFAKDHDIFTFHHNEKDSLDTTARHIWRDLKSYLIKDYDHIVFMGFKDDSDIVFKLNEDRNLLFDAAVFVNYEPTGEIDSLALSIDKLTQAQVNLYSFGYGGKKNRLDGLVENHQSLPIWTNLRSERLAQEIYGCVVYGTYKQVSLSGTNTEFIR